LSVGVYITGQNTSNETVRECDTGHYCVGGSQIICEPGKYQDQKKQYMCIQCNPGHSQANNGSISCIECAAGKFSEPGAKDCTDCEPGKYTMQGKATACLKCHPGLYLDSSGQSGTDACIQCPAGTFAAKAGDIECTICSAGKASEPKSSRCDECPAGTLCPEGAAKYRSDQVGGEVRVKGLDVTGVSTADREKLATDLARAIGLLPAAPAPMAAIHSKILLKLDIQSLPEQERGAIEKLLRESIAADLGVPPSAVFITGIVPDHGRRLTSRQSRNRRYLFGVTTTIEYEVKLPIDGEMQPDEVADKIESGGVNATSVITKAKAASGDDAVPSLANLTPSDVVSLLNTTTIPSTPVVHVTKSVIQVVLKNTGDGKLSIGFVATSPNSTVDPAMLGLAQHVTGQWAQQLVRASGADEESVQIERVQQLAVCWPGKFSSARSAECTQCAPGQYSFMPGLASCLECPLGKFGLAAGASSCITCPASKYIGDPKSTFCHQCPPFATSLAGADSKSRCFCGIGYYDNNRKNASSFGLSKFRSWISDVDRHIDLECLRCPDNDFECKTSTKHGWGATVKTLKTKPGFWRATNSTTVVYRCPDRFACSGGSFIQDGNITFTKFNRTDAGQNLIGNTKQLSDNHQNFDNDRIEYFTTLHDSEVYRQASEIAIEADAANTSGITFEIKYQEDRDSQCAEGYVGLMCSSCDTDVGYVKQGGACAKCDQGEAIRVKVVLITSMTIVVVVAICLMKRYHTSFTTVIVPFLQKRNMPFKIYLGFIQVVASIPENFRLVFPSVVMDFYGFMRYLNFFDVFSFSAHFRCAIDYNYYSFLFSKTFIPLAILGALITLSIFGPRMERALLVNFALLFSMTVYTGMYSSLFQYFNCRSYEDGESYLVVSGLSCPDEYIFSLI
jgi:hypothetical protein